MKRTDLYTIINDRNKLEACEQICGKNQTPKNASGNLFTMGPFSSSLPLTPNLDNGHPDSINKASPQSHQKRM